MTEVSLSSGLWMLKGFWPWVPLQGRSMETGDELMGVTDWIPATVPGGVHADLWRAGLIPDPSAALFVRPHVAGDSWWMAAGGAWETIFPKEAREVIVQCRAKPGAVFEGAPLSFPGTFPSIHFRALGDGARQEEEK